MTSCLTEFSAVWAYNPDYLQAAGHGGDADLGKMQEWLGRAT